jgi:acylphosphatase
MTVVSGIMASDTRFVRARLLIAGLVQGVNFRAYARRVAQEQGVHGWVRNRGDGRVEMLLEGEAAAVQTCIDWCHHGPPRAHVTEVLVSWEAYQGEFGDFVVRS